YKVDWRHILQLLRKINVQRAPRLLKFMPKAHPPTPAQRRALAQRLGYQLRIDEPLARHTSFRIGGPAALYFEATTPDALAQAVQAARELEIDYFLLGSGANILIGDRG